MNNRCFNLHKIKNWHLLALVNHFLNRIREDQKYFGIYPQIFYPFGWL